MNKLLQIFLTCLLFVGQQAYAQKRIGVVGVQGISSVYHKYYYLSAQQRSDFSPMVSAMVDFYSNNKDFITLDRQNINLINSEKELQKSEDFMDGYVVTQGRNEGLDYILSSVYDIDTRNLRINIIDVANEQILGSVDRTLDKNFFGIKDLKQQMIIMLLELNAKCFDASIPLVRITDSKGKRAKEALIAAGKDHKIKAGYVFEIFEVVEEEVNNKKLKRQSVLGAGKVLKVEDDNFSIIEINDGGEKILTSNTEKKKLFCRLIKN